MRIVFTSCLVQLTNCISSQTPLQSVIDLKRHTKITVISLNCTCSVYEIRYNNLKIG